MSNGPLPATLANPSMATSMSTKPPLPPSQQQPLPAPTVLLRPLIQPRLLRINNEVDNDDEDDDEPINRTVNHRRPQIVSQPQPQPQLQLRQQQPQLNRNKNHHPRKQTEKLPSEESIKEVLGALTSRERQLLEMISNGVDAYSIYDPRKFETPSTSSMSSSDELDEDNTEVVNNRAPLKPLPLDGRSSPTVQKDANNKTIIYVNYSPTKQHQSSINEQPRIVAAQQSEINPNKNKVCNNFRNFLYINSILKRLND